MSTRRKPKRLTDEQALEAALLEVGMDAWQFHEAAHEISLAAGAAWRVLCGAASQADKLELAAVMARIQRPPAPDARCIENMR
jgi:hypothetical protein